MAFRLHYSLNSWIDDAYEKSMKELDEFFGINWKIQKPSIVLVPDRKTIDLLWDRKTEDWLVGWAEGRSTVYLLDPRNYSKECSHKFSKKRYLATIKHELAHCFTSVLAKGKALPYWLNEGISIYLSGQLNFKKRPDKLENFLDYFDKCDKGVYRESGFAVESLVENYGKEKILQLIKSSRKHDSQEDFNIVFKSIYGFKPEYKNFKI